jgi:hypothetical protein
MELARQHGNIEYPFRDHVTVIERKDKIRGRAFNQVYPFIILQGGWRIDGDIIFLRYGDGPVKPYLFTGIIFMGKKTGNLDAKIEQFFETDITYLLVSEKLPSISSFLMVNAGLLLTS